MSSVAAVTLVHPFELAGLGKAPYRFRGVEKKGFQACPGAPVKGGSSCDFCPMGIMFCFWFESADGKHFKVGCDCALRGFAADPRMVRVISAAQAKLERAKREEAKARAAARNLVTFAPLLEELATWTEGFASTFGASLAKQIRQGKKPSSRQLELVERLRGERGAA